MVKETGLAIGRRDFLAGSVKEIIERRRELTELKKEVSELEKEIALKVYKFDEYKHRGIGVVEEFERIPKSPKLYGDRI